MVSRKKSQLPVPFCLSFLLSSSFHCSFPFLLFPSPFLYSFPFLLSPFPFLLSPFPFSFPSFFPFLLSPYFSPFSLLLSLLLALSLYKWNAAVTYRWRNPQSWFHKKKSCSLSFSLSPFSFPSSFHCPFPFLLSPFPFPSPFISPFCFLLSLSHSLPLSPAPFHFPLSPFLFSFLLSPDWIALSQVLAPSI